VQPDAVSVGHLEIGDDGVEAVATLGILIMLITLILVTALYRFLGRSVLEGQSV